MIFDLVTTLLVVAAVGLLLNGLLAPIESLAWWAGWSGESHLPLPETGVARPAHVLVYLSGIGSISGDELLAEEALFLDHLQALLPDVVIVRDVFPYSVKGVGLTSARAFARFWQLLDRMRLGGDQLLSSLINLRNVFQVAVAADPRYGPIFSCGVAQVIVGKAIAAGYRPDGPPLVLLGYSGGAQVAVGAAPYVRHSLGGRVHVISLGGVLDSDPGLRALSCMNHLVGEHDVMERIGRIVYPGRWPIARQSAWNVARRAGVVRIQRMPGMSHNTPGGYMDPGVRTTSGEVNPEVTARIIASIVRSI
jgi:hypothetical protein